MRTAIVAIVKNEHRFIKEWVDYHLALGFDDIYIYEDYRSDSHAQIFEGYEHVHVAPVSTIGVPDYNGTRVQGELYTKSLTMFKDKYDWILFSDIDEFLVLEVPLQELCEEFNDYTGILLDWKVYTANGHTKRPEGNVVDNYTEELDPDILIDRAPIWNKKSFVNINKAEKWYRLPHIIKDGVNVDLNNDPNRKGKVFQKAWLNHYFSKSWEDFVERIVERGNMNNYTRTYDLFFKINPGLKYMEDKLLESVRYLHCKKIMWISKDKKIISGGNIDIINKIKQKIIYGK